MQLPEKFKDQVRDFYDGHAKEDSEPFEIWPENWDAFVIFRRCSTQWTTLTEWVPTPHGGVMGINAPQGLKYEAVMSLIEFVGLENKSEIFEQIQVLEQGALIGFRELRERNGR